MCNLAHDFLFSKTKFIFMCVQICVHLLAPSYNVHGPKNNWHTRMQAEVAGWEAIGRRKGRSKTFHKSEIYW